MTTINDLFAGINGAQPTVVPPLSSLPPLLKRVPLALPLMPFQEKAVDHALRDNGHKGYSYIGLEMGLGKTPVGIAVIASSVAAGKTPILVVVPAALRINWECELAKFAPWLTHATLRGLRPPDGVTALPDVDVLIIGSTSLSPPAPTKEETKANIVPVGWYHLLLGNISGFVVDESHFFKNVSKRTKAMKDIAAATTGVRVLMSGTPTPNGRHTELAQQITLMGAQAWRDIGGEGMFWNHYAPKQDAYGTRGSNDAGGLYKAMSDTWYTRELRSNVLKMPPKGRKILEVEAQGKAMRDYLQVERDLIDWLQSENRDTRGAARNEALVKLTTMRILAGVAKVQGAVKHVIEVLTTSPGGVFVVAEHRDVMDGMLLGLARFSPASIEGGMTDTQRDQNVQDFTSGRSRVLVGQIQAAGVGLTLHGGGRNHHEVVVQLPWTPAALLQVEDRLHRIGQTNEVDIDICLAAIEGTWTIDERLWGMLESKAFNASSISDGVGQFLLSDAVEGLLDTYR